MQRASRALLGCALALAVLLTAGYGYTKAPYDEESPLLLRAKLPTVADYELFIWRIDFPPGTIVRPHKSAGHKIVLVLEGSVTAEIGAERYPVSSGEIFLVPADTRTAVYNANPDGDSRVLSILLAKVGEPLKVDLEK